MKLRYAAFVFITLFTCQLPLPAFATTKLKTKKHSFNLNYDHRGLLVTRDDGQYSFNLYGFLEADVMKFVNAQKLLRSGTNIRYATIYLTGKVARVWQYFVSYSISMDSLLDASIIYHGFQHQYIQIGQFTPNVGLSNWSRHPDINFLEWPLPVFIFSPGYPQGIHYNISGKYIAADASLFSGSVFESYTGKNPIGATARLIFSPIHKTTRALHFGISDWWQRPNNTHTVIFGTTPEANSHDDGVLVTTGPITQVNYYNILSGEFAGVYGPWNLQAEYYINRVQRNQQTNLRFSGYYATLGYFITGESMIYAYPLGAFTRPSSIDGKYGAWQLLARYSTVNLNSKAIQGGKEYNATIGLNWFVNHFITFKLNVIRAATRPAFNGKNVTAMIYAARAQIQF